MTGTFSTTTNRRRARTNHHAYDEPQRPTDFCAIDGEGINVFVCDSQGVISIEHRYVLIGVGQDQMEDIRGLSFSQILEFVYDHYKKGRTFTGFFLSYDFSNWFKTLPQGRAWMLLTRDGQAKRRHRRRGLPPHLCEFDGWQFDLLAGKRFRFRPKTCQCPIVSCKCKKAPMLYVNDVGGFFQSSLLAVIHPRNWPSDNPIVTPEEYEEIRRGKENRGAGRLNDDMRRYNRLENDILQRVLRHLDDGFRSIDVRLSPSKWFGPGQAAQAWMVHERAPKRLEIEETVPEWFRKAAADSYFGGWFEIMVHGIVPGISHEYDINSAYPNIIQRLPCLLHGTYTRGKGKPPDSPGQLTLVHARVWSQSYSERRGKKYIGAMLHRDSRGRICRPLMTEGWFWNHELKAAHRAGCITRISDNRYYEWVSYTPCDCFPPLRRVQSLYSKRLAVGKDSSLGKSSKLVYNSEYGKFAQSVGEPLFGNPIYASLITAGCRTQILDAIATHPKGKRDVLMVATDAIYFRTPHPTLELSQELGKWTHTEKRNLCLFKPGVYWDDRAREDVRRGDSPRFKARGINAKDFGTQLERIDRQFLSWNHNPPPVQAFHQPISGWPEVTFSARFSMTTALQALIQDDWAKAGSITDAKSATQSSNPHEKRDLPYYDEEDGIYRTEPLWFGIGSGIFADRANPMRHVFDVRSSPYEKRFGSEDPWSEENKEAYGVDPEGYMPDAFREILMGDEEC